MYVYMYSYLHFGHKIVCVVNLRKRLCLVSYKLASHFGDSIKGCLAIAEWFGPV